MEDEQGQFLAIPCNTQTKGQLIWFISIYAPPTDRNHSKEKNASEKSEFYTTILPELMKQVMGNAGSTDMVIIGMDANITMAPRLDTQWELYKKETRTQVMRQLYMDSGLLKEWVSNMDLKDIWREQHPQNRLYSRFPYMIKPDPEKIVVPKRIDYIMVNGNVQQYAINSGIINNSTLNWKSDHCIQELEMVGMPIIKKTYKIYQRPMWQTNLTEEEKILLQNKMKEVITQDVANSTTEFMEIGIQQWMEEKLTKTTKYRNINLYVASNEYKCRKDMVKMINETLEGKEGKEENIDCIGKHIIETYYSTDKQENIVENGFEKIMDKWKKEGKILETKDYKWIMIEWKKIMLEQMRVMEKLEIERKRELTMEKIRQGQRYAPWAGIIWKACKPYRRRDMGIPVLMGDEGELLTGKAKDMHMANFIRKQWGTEHDKLEDVPEELEMEKAPEELMNEILNTEITEAEVKRVIKKAKLKKGPGPDLIPYEIWKLGGPEVQRYLKTVFEYMRTRQLFPDSWKESDIKWIYKKGNQLSMANYRPIALSNTISKIFIRILTDRLMKLTEAARLIRDEQQGFRPDRSCTAAVLILKTLLARAAKKKEPFYMACLDISKAYDNVNHDRLWNICERMGIGGDWLKCIKELYKDNKIRGIGSIGMTEWIKVKRGIKQGCPMSPILFAIYTSMIPEMMEQSQCGKKGEPMVLMYADDMVVWGNTEIEIKNKIEVICKTFDMLGLQLSGTKTELQHNQWVKPNREGQTITIEHNNKTENITYLPIDKAIRYLGAWTTTEGNTDWGLELLKTKLEDRLKRINKLNLQAVQKATLIKGKIMAAWNYTAGIQNIKDEEIETLEKTLCQAVTSRSLGRTTRRDMLFEKRTKGGIGMISMHELYEINRCRIISQIMENGKRQRGRGQIPWAEKIVMEELMAEDSCMTVYKEIKEILIRLGLRIQQNGDYRLWKTQEMMYEQSYEKRMKNQKVQSCIIQKLI